MWKGADGKGAGPAVDRGAVGRPRMQSADVRRTEKRGGGSRAGAQQSARQHPI